MKALGMDAKSEEIRKLINDIDSDGDDGAPHALVGIGAVLHTFPQKKITR